VVHCQIDWKLSSTPRFCCLNICIFNVNIFKQEYIILISILLFSAKMGTDHPVSFGIVLFPAFQALDVFGPIDALNNLSLKYKMNLYLIAETMDPVSTQVTSQLNKTGSQFAQSIVPTHTFSNAPKLDVLMIPGGQGTREADEKLKPILDYISTTFPSLRWLFTVCTGSGLAAKAGVLDGLSATTNKRAWREITAWRPQVKWDVTKRWVKDSGGKVWTTSGISAGNDGIFAWVGEVYGDDEAENLANMSEYVRNKDPSFEPFAKLYGLV
jgi:transcriptional regulator GlxA family with amidase domain